MTILNPAPVTANADRAGVPERTWPTEASSEAAVTPSHSGGGPSRVVRRLDESDNGSPIPDRFGNSSPDARKAWDAVLDDAAALVAKAPGAN
jgi:hypothetical protein